MENVDAKKEALRKVLEFARDLKKEKIASKMKPKEQKAEQVEESNEE